VLKSAPTGPPILRRLAEDEENIMVLATAEEQHLHLNLFDHPEHKWRKEVEDVVDLWIHSTLGDLPFVPDDWDIISALETALEDGVIEGKKHPGPLWRDLGFKNKEEAWLGGALGQSVTIALRLQNGEDLDPRLSGPGGRAKLTTKIKYEKKVANGDPVGRFIRMVDVCDVAIAGVLKKALDSIIDWSQWTALGLSYFAGGGRQYAEYFRYDVHPDIEGCGLDMSKCDARFPVLLTEKLMWHLFKCFNGKISKQTMQYVIRVHCDSICVDPKLSTVRTIKHGLCSGAPFTSLLESLGVLCMTDCCLFFWNGRWRSDLRLKSLGDDQWMTATDDLPDTSEFRTLMWDLFGQIINEDTPRGIGINEYEFLGKRLTPQYFPWRDDEETVLQLVYPEREVQTVEQSFARGCGLLIDNFFNRDARYALRHHLNYLYDNYGVDSVPWESIARAASEGGMWMLTEARDHMMLEEIRAMTDLELCKLYGIDHESFVEFDDAYGKNKCILKKENVNKKEK